MPKRIQFRRDTADNWAFHNPRLMPGEIGMETDTQKFKIGDGDLDWEDLPYYLSLAAQEGALDEAVDAAVLDATNLASGYKDAAAGSAAAAADSATAADASANAAGTSATEAEAAAAAAEAVGTTTDAIVSDLVDDTGSATRASIDAILPASAVGIESMTTAERDALGTVPNGTTIYNSTHNRLETYEAPLWMMSLSGPDSIGGAFTTGGLDINMGGIGAITGSYGLGGGILQRWNYSGSSTFDVSDGMGGASAGYGTINAPCAFYEGLGSNQPGYDEPTNLGITLNIPGIYMWINQAVVKSNGGSGRSMEVYLRKNSGGTRTGGTGIRSIHHAFVRYDNIYHHFAASSVFMHTGSGDYNVVYTMGTSASNLSSLGYGTGWQLIRLSNV